MTHVWLVMSTERLLSYGGEPEIFRTERDAHEAALSKAELCARTHAAGHGTTERAYYDGDPNSIHVQHMTGGGNFATYAVVFVTKLPVQGSAVRALADIDV